MHVRPLPFPLQNAALAATTAHLFSVCIETLMKQDVDLVVVEFSLGDAESAPQPPLLCSSVPTLSRPP